MIYRDVSHFYRKFKGEKRVIGYSFCGREIYAMHTGDSGGRQYVCVYAVHGREWITARLALKHLRLGSESGVWIIPLLNPDGAVISQKKDKLWKANARGVDLNCNFDADWGGGKLNTRVRGRENCIGDFPFSECETVALKRFTERVKPVATISFHTKGEEIYWEYGGRGDERGARILSEATGYSVKKITGSCGGYKDWCIQKLNIAAYTVECGADTEKHPIKRLKALRPAFGALRYFTEHYEKQVYEERT